MLHPASGVPGWSGPTVVTPTNNSSLHYSPSTVTDNAGDVYLFWDQNPGVYYVVTNTGQISSNNWPAPKQYTKNNNLDIEPAPVSLKNGTLILFFTSKRANQYDIYYSKSNDLGQTWSTESQLTNSAASDTSPSAMQDMSGKIWLSWTRQETGDINLRFVDANGNGAWDPGEQIVYDADANAVYSAPDIMIAGTAPPLGTALKFDTRIGFVDANGSGLWDLGEFVVYDPNTDSIFDPKLMYIDSNNNNVWNPGETIIYKGTTPNSTLATFTGIGRCAGTGPPLSDCVIIGSVPSSSTILKIDTHIKFVDTNADGLWEPGEILVYDVNSGVNGNSGLYVANDTAIAPLTSDSKLRFIGSGSSWVSGSSTVVYDTNGNGRYDAGIMFVDDNFTGHWVQGDTVIYDSNHNDFYDFGDVPIYDPACALSLSSCDFQSTTKLPKNDPGLRFVDTNANGVWDSGEPVVYDSDLNGAYETKLKYVRNGTNVTWVPGESTVWDSNNDGKFTTGKYYNDTVVAGVSAANNTALYIDPKLKFVDTNGDMKWENGECVVYDANNNNLYDTGDSIIVGSTPVGTGLSSGLGEPVIASGAPGLGTPLSSDTKLRYVQSSGSSTWGSNTTQTVAYDSNGNGVYDTGEPIISGAAVSPGTVLSYDPLVKFYDSDGNGVWDSAEPVVYDALNKGSMQSGYAQYDMIRGTIPQPLSSLAYNIGDPWISGPAPVPGTTLKSDGLIKFVDLNSNGYWDSTGVLSSQYSMGEPVEYDLNNNGIFDAGVDMVISGSPVPAINTPLKNDEVTLAGTTAVLGTTLHPQDPKMKYVDSNSNGHWDLGETVVYDLSGNNKYVAGRSFNDTIVAGAAPLLNNTSLSVDSKLKFFDANRDNVWLTGEPVFYDNNGNGVYDTGDSIVAVSPAPVGGAVLSVDSKIKYFETGTDGHWDPGESVVYDKDSSGTFTSGDAVIAGPVPSIGSILSADSKMRFVDNNGNNAWDLGETVVYDNNTNNAYDSGEPVISGRPSLGTPLRSIMHIFYKTYNGVSWSADQRLTTQPYSDQSPSIRQTEDGRIWIVWSGNRPGGPNRLLYRTSPDGVTWVAENSLTSSPADYGDNDPSIMQDRNGTLWIAFTRNLACGNCGQAAFQADVFTMYSTNNGASWALPVDRTNVTTTYEIQPDIVQLSDKNLYIFYSLVSCGGSTCTAVLDYFKTSSQVLIHDANMNKFTTNATLSITYGYNVRMGQALRLSANVTNAGDFSDTLLLNAKANSTLISTTNSSTVPTGQSAVIFIDWHVSVPRPGRYILTANVTDTSGAEGSPNLVDNTRTFTVLIRPAGDVNTDCIVDVSDLAQVGASFGKSRGQTGYNAAADLNNDGIVDVADLAIFGGSFGQTC